MIIKVALTGTHGVGKTFIVDNVAALAMNEGWNTEIVYSPTRWVKGLGSEYGMANNMNGDWHFQWHVMSATQLRAWEAEKRAKEGYQSDDSMRVGEHNGHTLIIGDRCCWDPVACTADLITRVGSVASADAFSRLRLLKQIHMLGLRQAQEDTFWDQVFFKPHHPDHLTADPDRLDDRDYQLAVEQQFAEMLFADGSTNGDDVHILDKDRNVAVDEIWEMINAQARREHPQGD